MEGRRASARCELAGEIGEVAVGDALVEAEVFERRGHRIIVVDPQLARLEAVEGCRLVEPGLRARITPAPS
jgi:uncharacterized UPF0146 family protein